MNAQKILRTMFIIAIPVAIAGCESFSGTMSRIKDESSTTIWQSFEHVQHDFASIKIGETKAEDLEKFGLGPRSQNVLKVNYLKLRSYFIGDQQAMTNESLTEAVQKCIAKKDACYGLVVRAQKLHELGLEDLSDRMTKAEKITQQTGWKFEGVIVVEDETVVYAQPTKEEPNLYTLTKGKDPQSVLEKVIAPLTSFFSFF